VTKQIPGSRGYAVQYPAYLNVTDSAPRGVADVINRLNTQGKACPKQKFALVGYSQGAGVMHGALNPSAKPKLDTAVFDRVLALVMFGDPGYQGQTGPSPDALPTLPPVLFERLRENCAPGDPVSPACN
jgi:cutinase